MTHLDMGLGAFLHDKETGKKCHVAWSLSVAKMATKQAAACLCRSHG